MVKLPVTPTVQIKLPGTRQPGKEIDRLKGLINQGYRRQLQAGLYTPLSC